MRSFRSRLSVFALFVMTGTGVLAQTNANVEGASVEQLSQQADAFRRVIASLEGDAATAQTAFDDVQNCLLYTSPSPRDLSTSRMPSSA